jgi:hypothetical protein
MQHLHKHLRLFEDDELEIRVTGPAHVFLMDEDNYRSYREGEDFDYYGGLVRRTPLRMRAPRAGPWHLVVEQAEPGRPLDVVVQLIQG